MKILCSFFKNNGVKIGIAILAFVFLFKIGEAFLGRMSLVFYKEIGFSKGDIAIFSKALGWITTIVFIRQAFGDCFGESAAILNARIGEFQTDRSG